MKKAVKKTYPRKNSEMPVTQPMLYEVRNELREQILSTEKKLDSKIHSLEAKVHNIQVLIEEQNARNSVVLDGLSNLFERQERIESEHADFRKIMLGNR